MYRRPTDPDGGFNGMSATLGWHINIESPIHFERQDRSTTAWAPVFMVCWVLAESAVLVLAFEQIMRYRSKSPWLRMPSLGGRADLAGSRLGLRLHQALILWIAIAPLYAGGRFLIVTLTAVVNCGETLKIHTLAEHLTLTGPAGVRCWLDGAERGVEYFPRWEGWAFLVAFTAIVFAWLALLRLLTKPNLNSLIQR
jgi:hypothetical protein